MRRSYAIPQTDDIDSISFTSIAFQTMEYRQPNGFFTGLLNGIFLSLPVWTNLCTLKGWIF
jgi:hypothetical protein